MAHQKQQKKKMIQKNQKEKPELAPQKPKSIRELLAKVAILAAATICVIYFSDQKDWFAPDATNNHAQRKWDSYYQFTQKNEVDIVMVGNSHLYAGINPKNLSCALGANCFILAAPGTTITDAYYCLKEALTVSKPKIAVIETYAISDYKTHDFKDGALSDQFQSFKARKNLKQKLLSTPVLFASRNYMAAWSNTIRNHSYILTDREQIKKNIKLKKTKKTEQGLYLGRFVSFPTGMTDTTLLKYDIPGAASIVDGNNFKAGDEAKRYVDKIITLCRENDVEPVFLTIPMYYRHVKDYDVWKERLNEELTQYEPVWLDLQSPYDDDAFIHECFENSVRSNQHLSYAGSLVCSYKLAHFIREKYPDLLTNRYADADWNNMFYGEEGYFENYSPKPNDKTAFILSDEIEFSNLVIKEINLVPKKEFDMLYIKVDRKNEQDLRKNILQLYIEGIYHGEKNVGLIEAETTPMYDPLNHYLFMNRIIKDVELLEIRSVVIGNKNEK